MIDSEDELLISTFNRKSNLTNGKKDLHSGVVCKFCKQKWSFCALYLEILNNGSFDNNDKSSEIK
ncbi:hypothetical protein Glove_417g19 [Diversispora epigaea]|uniref:Uncharacterized protein n=1 Tax=Diversispora epigaea TaxID=1348612 RepID=A0A397GW62_9GLOM|nr:hypothetical protein Glove_417g19 [Diversispora epigaea]